MKRIMMILFFIIYMFSFPVYASEPIDESTEIPVMSIEEFMVMMNARQAKVDIIKKNNKELTILKEELKAKILEAATKVNNLSIDISKEEVDIPDEVIVELKELVEFLQEAKNTLESDVQKISDEIEEILDLISTKGMQLEQYDLIIEKQNTVIIKMKEILEMVNKI